MAKKLDDNLNSLYNNLLDMAALTLLKIDHANEYVPRLNSKFIELINSTNQLTAEIKATLSLEKAPVAQPKPQPAQPKPQPRPQAESTTVKMPKIADDIFDDDDFSGNNVFAETPHAPKKPEQVDLFFDDDVPAPVQPKPAPAQPKPAAPQPKPTQQSKPTPKQSNYPSLWDDEWDDEEIATSAIREETLDAAPTPQVAPKPAPAAQPQPVAAAPTAPKPAPVSPAPAGKAPSGPCRSSGIKSFFTVNDQFRFCRELFGNNNASMTDTLNTFAAMSTIDEATDYINHDLGWDPMSSEVQDFIIILKKFFASN